DRVCLEAVHPAVDLDDRRALLAETAQDARVAAGRGDDDAVDPHALEKLQVLLLRSRVVVAVAEHDVVPGILGDGLDVLRDRGVERVLDVSDEQPGELSTPGTEAAGDLVRDVADFPRGVQDRPARLLGGVAGAGQNAPGGCHRDTGPLRDIGDGNHHAPPAGISLSRATDAPGVGSSSSSGYVSPMAARHLSMVAMVARDSSQFISGGDGGPSRGRRPTASASSTYGWAPASTAISFGAEP